MSAFIWVHICLYVGILVFLFVMLKFALVIYVLNEMYKWRSVDLGIYIMLFNVRLRGVDFVRTLRRCIVKCGS